MAERTVFREGIDVVMISIRRFAMSLFALLVTGYAAMLMATEKQSYVLMLLAGGAVVTLLSGLSNPTYLALDPGSGVMYWSEGGAGAQHIYRSQMTGGSKTVLPLPLMAYGGLAFQPSGQVSAPPNAAPLEFALAPLAPNPARGPVRATFTVPHECHVRLSVIDLMGREVVVIADGSYPEGRHEASWDSNAGKRVPAGIYFMRMVVGERAWTRRFVTR